MAGRALLSILVFTLLVVAPAISSAQILSNGSLSSNEALAIFREVQATNFALQGNILMGNLTGADEFLAADVQIVVANMTAPLT